MLAHQTHSMNITPMNNLHGMALRNTSNGRGPTMGKAKLTYVKGSS